MNTLSDCPPESQIDWVSKAAEFYNYILPEYESLIDEMVRDCTENVSMTTGVDTKAELSLISSLPNPQELREALDELMVERVDETETNVEQLFQE